MSNWGEVVLSNLMYLVQILYIKIRDTKMCATLNLVILAIQIWVEFGKEKKNT